MAFFLSSLYPVRLLDASSASVWEDSCKSVQDQRMDGLNDQQTNVQTDQWTNGWTNTPSYGKAWTHLNMSGQANWKMSLDSDVAAYLPYKHNMMKGLLHAALCTSLNMLN